MEKINKNELINSINYLFKTNIENLHNVQGFKEYDQMLYTFIPKNKQFDVITYLKNKGYRVESHLNNKYFILKD